MQLEYEGTVLRALNSEESSQLHELSLRSTGVETTTPYWVPRSERWFDAFIRSGNENPMKRIRLGVEADVAPRGENKLVGIVELLDINWIHRRAEVGIILYPDEVRGRGLGTRALTVLANWAFDTIGLHRLYAKVFATNRAALRCFEKVGFEKEGVLREHFFVDGEWLDGIQLGLLSRR